MQSIEFFSGSGTVSRVLKFRGFDAFTIDINKKLKPDLCIDILELTKSALPPRADFLWFSPDCTCFSRAAKQSHWIKKELGYRKYFYTPATPEAQVAIKLIEKVAEIISWYPNANYVIENPIGRIQHAAALKSLGHHRYAVNYADYGFNYSKETYLFTNLMLPLSTVKVHSCKPGLRSVKSAYKRSIVPPALVMLIANYL
jgi:site-specific DNA-cytosine methylase